jgi:hypothetical protein
LPYDAEEDLLGRSIGAKHPVRSIEELHDDRKGMRVNLNFDTEITLLDGLTLTPRIGVNHYAFNNKYFEGQYAEGMTSTLRISDHESTHLENSNILTYTSELGGHSRLTITGVNEWIKSQSYTYRVSESEIEDESFGYYQLGLGAKQDLPSSGVSEYSLLSYLGRINTLYWIGTF